MAPQLCAQIELKVPQALLDLCELFLVKIPSQSPFICFTSSLSFLCVLDMRLSSLLNTKAASWTTSSAPNWRYPSCTFKSSLVSAVRTRLAFASPSLH